MEVTRDAINNVHKAYEALYATKPRLSDLLIGGIIEKEEGKTNADLAVLVRQRERNHGLIK